MSTKKKPQFHVVNHSVPRRDGPAKVTGKATYVSDVKLPGMASDFYKTQVARHLTIGIRAMERLSTMPLERLHSRKLRSFDETAFL